MSLVIAFIGVTHAVMAGDVREIQFRGAPLSEELLEEELYSGRLVTDAQLTERAEELGVYLIIKDTKTKVNERGGVLIGEVSSRESGRVQKRRLYASADSYAIADITGTTMIVRQRGKGSNFIVLGNSITKQIAHTILQERWKTGTVSDAIALIVHIMMTASRRTASVSQSFTLVQTASTAEIEKMVERDRDTSRI